MLTKFFVSVISGLSWLAWRVPRRVLLLFGDVIGLLWFDVFRIRRGVALRNLELAFPDWPKTKRVKIARASLRSLGRSFVEYFLIPRIEECEFDKNFRIFGMEFVDEARRHNKGVCFLTLHLGNGDLAISAMSSKKYPMNLITKEFKFKALNEAWFELRKRVGTKLIKPRKSHFEILRALRNNEMVVFVLDQHMGPPLGVKTQFFKRNVGTALGLAIIAARTRAPVIPGFTRRLPNGFTELHFFPPVPFIDSSDPDQTLAEMTQRYTDQLETFVRQHPDQWLWIHKRFKGFRDT